VVSRSTNTNGSELTLLVRIGSTALTAKRGMDAIRAEERRIDRAF